ncbi:sigma-70 family RNA polymerase sigma factor [Chitinophaga sedimenti]|uniref:sigma-70 family RNA polymerase sigma factor n=1 Tax=Chitinophaga sedimenti TaxID=2033606 RepID=UPI003558B9E7
MENLHTEVMAKVMGTLQILTPREREVIRLLYLNEMTVEEIAAKMGVKKTRVYNLKSNALKVIKNNI